jgi:uncharacterized RDD family membrane protein YckC
MELIRCSGCGREFSGDDLIKFGDSMVCAGCKPLFVQRLREGLVLAAERVYGGFWIRAGAKIIDGIIVTIIDFALGFLGNLMGPGIVGSLFQSAISIFVGTAYVTYFLGKYSATPGKMACNLKVIRPDGEPVSYARAFGRSFAEWLSTVLLCIGYIMAAFDEEKRALHDRICDTRVIKT